MTDIKFLSEDIYNNFDHFRSLFPFSISTVSGGVAKDQHTLI